MIESRCSRYEYVWDTKIATKSGCTSIGQRTFKIESSAQGQRGTVEVKLKDKKDMAKLKISLSEPFQSGKGGGAYIGAMHSIGKYYFLLACEGRGLDLQDDDWFADQKFEQYLRSGANAYHARYPLKNAQHMMVNGERNGTETVEAAQATLGLLSNIGNSCTPESTHQTLLSPASPPPDQQGPSQRLDIEGQSSIITESLDINGRDRTWNELLRRKEELDDQIEKAEVDRDRIVAALRQYKDSKQAHQAE
ncbi:hypothetical protein DPSP01_004300 [Paraphaeosphaeria sporulosa]